MVILIKLWWAMNLCDLPILPPEELFICAVPGIGKWYLVASSELVETLAAEGASEQVNGPIALPTLLLKEPETSDYGEEDQANLVEALTKLGWDIEVQNKPPWPKPV